MTLGLILYFQSNVATAKKVLPLNDSSMSLTARLLKNLPRRGVPGNRVGGAVRGNCTSGSNQLVALLPETNFGLTMMLSPKFYVFVPTTEAKTAELRILDQSNNVVHESTIQLPASEGMISLSPNFELELGQAYRWIFSLVCGDEVTDRVSVGGSISRVIPSSALESEDPQVRLEQMVDLGLWYDALAVLFDLYSAEETRDFAQATLSEIVEAFNLPITY